MKPRKRIVAILLTTMFLIAPLTGQAGERVGKDNGHFIKVTGVEAYKKERLEKLETKREWDKYSAYLQELEDRPARLAAEKKEREAKRKEQLKKDKEEARRASFQRIIDKLEEFTVDEYIARKNKTRISLKREIDYIRKKRGLK